MQATEARLAATQRDLADAERRVRSGADAVAEGLVAEARAEADGVLQAARDECRQAEEELAALRQQLADAEAAVRRREINAEAAASDARSAAEAAAAEQRRAAEASSMLAEKEALLRSRCAVVRELGRVCARLPRISPSMRAAATPLSMPPLPPPPCAPVQGRAFGGQGAGGAEAGGGTVGGGAARGAPHAPTGKRPGPHLTCGWQHAARRQFGGRVWLAAALGFGWHRSSQRRRGRQCVQADGATQAHGWPAAAACALRAAAGLEQRWHARHGGAHPIWRHIRHPCQLAAAAVF